ncbi:MAG: Hsp20/alpha crystallin family protein [Planctomycetota bacterium]|nr:Hsp20/alpha crystallin family protein [Planctomycetota bacterium]
MDTQANTHTERTGKRVSTFRPGVDVFESAEAFTIIADIPGVKPEQVELDFEQNVLNLSARVAPRGPSHEDRAVRLAAEYPVGDFERTFRFDDSIDTQNASATCVDGVLTVTVPKSESARRRRIPVA